jgi:polar amino acid transport system substrate-binding protein
MMMGTRSSQFTAVLAALLPAAMLALPPSPLLARPLDKVKEAGSLRVILYADNKPFSWTLEDGTQKGIDVDVANAIAVELGVKADVVLRMPGEDLGDDLRGNVVRGPLTGGGTGDVMLHVPTDKELAEKNPKAIIGNSYFQETVALAIDPKRIPPATSDFQIFKKEKIGVKLATVADYFLMTFEDGALINNISHYVKGRVGAKEFMDGETAAILGVRSETEGTLKDAGGTAEFITPKMDGIVRTQWSVGTAVNEESRDLGDAIGEALKKMSAAGALKDIFAKYGVTYVPPPTN